MNTSFNANNSQRNVKVGVEISLYKKSDMQYLYTKSGSLNNDNHRFWIGSEVTVVKR